MAWIKSIVSQYSKAIAEDKECCLVVREFNSFFIYRRRFTIDKLEWETIGKTMNWK